jgi:membrane protease subunit HflK
MTHQEILFAQKPIKKIFRYFKNQTKLFLKLFAFNQRPSNKKYISISLAGQIIFTWLLLGFYIVPPSMEAVITRFGNYQRTEHPGLHWRMRFIEKVFKLEVNQPKTYSYNLSALTADHNLVSAVLEVKYSIHNSRLYLFGMVNAPQLIEELITSAFQKAVGDYSLSSLLLAKTNLPIQKIAYSRLKPELEHYPLGITLWEASIPLIQPPLEFKKELESLEKTKNEAQEIKNQSQLKIAQIKYDTELHIQQLDANATAEKDKKISKAKIETQRFLALLPYYEQDPKLTLQRLYFSKIEELTSTHPTTILMQPIMSKNPQHTPVHIAVHSTSGSQHA